MAKTPNAGLPLSKTGYFARRRAFRQAMKMLAARTGLKLSTNTFGPYNFATTYRNNIQKLNANLGMTLSPKLDTDWQSQAESLNGVILAVDARLSGTIPPALAMIFAVTIYQTAEGAAGTTTTVSNTISVTRNGVTGALTVPLTYSGTATRNTDYTAPDSVTIPSGASSVTFNVVIAGDDAVEPDETIIIGASVTGHGATATKTITILNDDTSGTPDLVGGMAVGSTYTSGPFNGWIFTYGDDFNGNLSIIGPAPQDRFNLHSTTRGNYMIPASGQGPRSSEGLGGYDSDPKFTGFRNSNRGKPVASMSDMITQANGTLTLKQRPMTGDEPLHVSRNNQSVLSSMLTTALRNLVRAPGGFEWMEKRIANSKDHMTGWVMQRIGNTENDIEGDVEAGSHPDGTGDGTKVEFNNNVWFSGSRSSSRSMGSSPVTVDWSVPHKFAIKMTEAGALEYYMDDVLMFTFDTEGTAVLRDAYHMIWTAHMYNVSRPTTESRYEISWYRTIAKLGHYKPKVAPVLIQVAANENFNVTLPTQTALWGKTLNEDIQALMCEANEPGGTTNGVVYGDSPPGLVINKTTPGLSGSTATPGRVQYGRYASESGYSSEVHRFVLEVGPAINVEPFSVTQGVPVDIDIYKMIDFGILVTDGTNASTTIAIANLPAGLSFSNATGKLTGTTTVNTGNISLRITATNSVSQTAIKDLILSVVAQPVNETYAYQSHPALVADFDMSLNALFVNATGDVPSIGNPIMRPGANAGDPQVAAGGLVKAPTVTPFAQRKSSILNGRSTVSFTRGSDGAASTVLESDMNTPLSNVLSGTDSNFTLVMLFRPTAAFVGLVGGWGEQINSTSARNCGIVRRTGSSQSSFRFGNTTSGSPDRDIGVLSENVWYLVIARHVNGVSDVWVNKAKVVDAVAHTSVTSWGTTSRFSLGNMMSNTGQTSRYPGTAFHGDIAHGIVFNAGLADADLLQMQSDLYDKKWKLAA